LKESRKPGESGDVKNAVETRHALRLTAVILCTLTVVKYLGSIPFIGHLGFTAAAFLQLYLPLRRCDTPETVTPCCGRCSLLRSVLPLLPQMVCLLHHMTHTCMSLRQHQRVCGGGRLSRPEC
jgi:hypothetical protein